MTIGRLIAGLIVLVVALTGVLLRNTSAPIDNKNQQRFFCGNNTHSIYGIVPATIVKTPRGNVPMIHWVSNWIKNPNWPRQKRCDEVAKRLNRYDANGMLKYIRTGKVKIYPVICVASSEGGNCNERDVVVTLEPGSDAEEVLQEMTDLRGRSRKKIDMIIGDNIIFDVDGEAYIHVKYFLKKAPVQKIASPEEELRLW